MQNHRKIFYGWWIVLAGFMLSGVSIGININCNTALLEPVCSSLGISISAFSLSTSITSFASIPCYLLLPGFMHRISMRKYIAFCGVGFILFKILFGLSNHVWQIYICALGIGICAPGLSYMVINSLLNNWFYEKNATVVGITAAGGGILGALILPVVTAIVSCFGWRAGYFTEALMSGILIFFAVILVRDTPEEAGEKPYAPTAGIRPDVLGQTEGRTLKEAVRCPSFYFLLAALFLLCVSGMGIQPYLMSYLGTVGYSTGFAAGIVSLILVSVTFGKIGMGALFDRLGLAMANILIGGSMIASLFLLSLVSNGKIVTVAFAVVFGFAYANMSIPAPYLTGKLFGKKDFSAIYGVVMVGTSIGGTVGNLLTGVIFEQMGRYQDVWYLYIGIMAAVMALLHLAIRLSPYRMESLKTGQKWRNI